MSDHAGIQAAAVDRAILERLDNLTHAVATMAKVSGARLTRAEVCARLKCHRNTLRGYIERGFPKPTKDGHWLLSEVIEWEAQR